MLKEWYVLKIYTASEIDQNKVLACEVDFDDCPDDVTIERTICAEVGCDGIGKIVKRYRPKVPFA